MVNTRSLQQDELYRKSIATQINNHVDSVNAVLILLNGTVPRSTVGIDNVLSTLSAVFPKPLTSNVAFVFTNVSNPLSWNFRQDTIPAILKDAPQFQIDNPIALQTKYLRIRDDQGMESMRAEMREEVKAAEQDSWDGLVNLFDWVDGLDSQPTMGAVHHHEESQNIVANVFMSLTEQMKQLRRKVKRKVQEGVRKVKQIFIG